MLRDMASVTKIIRVSGTAIPRRGNDIDTDRIIPARYMKEITFTRMGEYPFYDERFDLEGKPKPHPFNDPRYKGASILLVNKNFGCGSSREHAPQALFRFGLRAIVGESFAAIFAGNCVMMGIPAVTVTEEKIEECMARVESQPQTVIALDLETKALTCGELEFPFDVPETFRRAMVDGLWDSTSLLLSNMGKVRETAGRLPYLPGFGR